MKEYLEHQIEMLKNEINYYTKKIEESKNNKLLSSNDSNNNYFDREIYYAEYHLFKAQAELNRLQLKSDSYARTLRK